MDPYFAQALAWFELLMLMEPYFAQAQVKVKSCEYRLNSDIESSSNS